MAELTEDPLAPLVRHLRRDPELQEFHSLIPQGGINPVLGPPTMVLEGGQYVAYKGNSNLWVFRGFDKSGLPFVNVEGTGSSAITLEEGTPWSRKVPGKSAVYMQLNVYYHCDVTRDDTIGAPVAYDARDKCISLHKRVSRMLNIAHKGTGGFLLWGAKEDGSNPLRVISSQAAQELQITAFNEGDGMVEGEATFDLAILP